MLPLLRTAARLASQGHVFDAPTAARERLARRDAFIERLRPFDRAARMKINGPVDRPRFIPAGPPRP